MKKNLLPAVFAGLLLASALADPAAPNGASTSPQAPSAPGSHAVPQGRFPAVHAALTALERAKAELVAAPHDFGGHRAEAIAACDAASGQLNLALQYAAANP